MSYTEEVLELILYFNKMTINDGQKNKIPQPVNRLIDWYLMPALAVFQLHHGVLNQYSTISDFITIQIFNETNLNICS